MVVGENKRTNIMDGIENTGDVRLHDHRLRLKQRFDIVRKLGQGTYGKVQLGINKKTGQEVAIKTIKKCKIESEADLVRIRREVQIMSSVRHPNIVHIYEVFENSEKMILVMEYCSGGELYDYLSQKKVLQEDEARRLFRQIATAVYYCHIHKICHRDLKLENVLLDDTGSAKIADFGLSNVFKETSLLSTFCGSPLYASPEIVKGTPYIGPEVDCWSLGVLLYTLVYGAMPFDGSNFKRLVRQISNGDYYEPKAPSSASPLIRDMLTVDPLKRADIVYICDHPWVNTGCETSCLEMSEALAAETPVRLDLLLSLAPAAPSNSNSVMMPNTEAELGPEESCPDISNSASMAVEPSNSAEKRILDLVAEGGEDAIKPSPTRTIVSAGDNKRKLELAMSASGLQRKKERVASSARLANSATRDIVSEEGSVDTPPTPPACPPPELTPPAPEDGAEVVQPSLKSSATMTITPAAPKAPSPPAEPSPEPPKEAKEKPAAAKPRVTVKKKVATQKSLEDKAAAVKQDEEKPEEPKPTVASATDKLTSLSLSQPSTPAAAPAAGVKPKKLSLGGSVGSFKEQFERRASLTNPPEVKRTVTKPVVSKIAKPKAQSEDRDLPFKTTPEAGSVRLQQIGIEPSQMTAEGMNAGGVKKTESEPSHSTTTVDPTVLLQDARRSLQNSMAKLVEEKTGEDIRRRAAARDIISSAIRTGKPPVPYGRSSSAGVTSLSSPPGTPPAPAHAPPAPRVFRTEAQHRVEDHRANSRGASVERIIPIHVSEETPPAATLTPPTRPAPVPSAGARPTPVSLRRLVSSESGTSEPSPACSTPGGEPIKKSAREFIIPIAVEGKGYVTPRQGSLEPEGALAARPHTRLHKPRRISSLVSGGESEEEDDSHMHRLRSTRAARAESVSSGEEDEEDEGFHLLTAENLFSTLLHRVRALTNRLNGEEGPGFPSHPHSLFNNLQSPFFQHSPHLSRRHNALREGWGSRDLHSDFDSMFNKTRPSFPRGSSKKSSKHQSKAPQTAEANADSGLDLSDLDLSSIQFSEKEMAALSGLTPALSRRLQKQLLAHLPPAAARTLRRTLSLQGADRTGAGPAHAVRSHSATKSLQTDSSLDTSLASADHTDPSDPDKTDSRSPDPHKSPKKTDSPLGGDDGLDVPIPQFSTLPRLKRHSALSRETTPPASSSDIGYDHSKLGVKEASISRGSSVRSTPDRPLLSKYLTPDRTVSLDESFSSDSGSILSEPSYIAAYGQPGAGTTFGGFRRHSMRATPSDQPRKRISRFLRPDFFDTPPDESQYAKLKKEKELETQKVLKEIREKKNKPYDPNASVRSPVEASDAPQFKDDTGSARKSLTPLGLLTAKERSRSTTPFFPILDNIKESMLDTSMKNHDTNLYDKYNTTKVNLDDVGNKESKLMRPKSYPVKNLNSIDRSHNDSYENDSQDKENEVKEKLVHKESKLIRPKSYPTSSPSPEKVYVSKTAKKERETKPATNSHKTEVLSPETSTDVEVSFSICLPKKTKSPAVQKADSVDKSESNSESASEALILRKYQVVGRSESIDQMIAKSESKSEVKNDIVEKKQSNGTVIGNGSTVVESKMTVTNNESKKEDVKLKSTDTDPGEKKTTIKKRIIKKVSSKSKADMVSQDGTESKVPIEKKKVTKKVKEKSVEGETKPMTTVKKKSVLQTIGHKIEKFTSNKSSSPDKDKDIENKSVPNDVKKESPVKETKLSRTQRENSVPADIEPATESDFVKRAVTLTDGATLESPANVPNKTTVSKVLGLFKKFDTKEKVAKPTVEKSSSDNIESQIEADSKNETVSETDLLNDNDKPKRPTSLLLNGLGRKNKYGRTSSDSVSVTSLNNDEPKKEIDSKRNSLKLDFSRLPRVKKIVPTNPVIEPQFSYAENKASEGRNGLDKNSTISDGTGVGNISSVRERSRSRSRSTFSNADIKPDHVVTIKVSDEHAQCEMPHPHRERTPTTPEKEDIVERIRRKSFYSRFNEKKARRKSNLVGPGAAEYDPLARLHGQTSEPKYDMSPTSPLSYDLSPGFSGTSDLSPSTERYRSLLAELPVSPRSAIRFENYGLNDKVDSYRSLDRNEFRKHPSGRSYMDYDQPSPYGANRYARTLSLMDSSDGTEDPTLAHIRDPHKYNRTISMYSPGSYATYRPKRTRNSAIILKDSEKEPSPENILEKIRQRKTISISVTRKPDPEKTPTDRSPVTPKGEGDSAECSEKVD